MTDDSERSEPARRRSDCPAPRQDETLASVFRKNTHRGPASSTDYWPRARTATSGQHRQPGQWFTALRSPPQWRPWCSRAISGSRVDKCLIGGPPRRESLGVGALHARHWSARASRPHRGLDLLITADAVRGTKKKHQTRLSVPSTGRSRREVRSRIRFMTRLG